jgi:hypothetical protein
VHVYALVPRITDARSCRDPRGLPNMPLRGVTHECAAGVKVMPVYVGVTGSLLIRIASATSLRSLFS